MGRVKRHHHTAQAYLKRFADGNGRLMVYDRITQETRLQHVSKVAVESDLYAISDADGQPNDFFERGLFQSVDGAIAPILSKLLEDRSLLTHSERDNVNAYLVLQHGRTPFMRDTLEDIHDLMLRRHVETSVGGGSPEEVERFIEEFEPHASEDEKDTIRQIAADPSQPVAMNRLYWIRSLVRLLPSLTEAMGTRQWSLVDVLGGAFLTGDLPVVLAGLHPLAIGDAPAIFWPLSPKRMLMLGPPGSYNGRSFKGSIAPANTVREINQLTADVAARQIFWHPETDPTAVIVLPVGARTSSVNGITVAAGERSYDKIRGELQDDNPRSEVRGPND